MRKVIFVVLLVTMVILASPLVIAALISPVAENVSAKSIQTKSEGQQLAMSFDNNKSFVRISWVSGNQILKIKWLACGYLLVQTVKSKIPKNYRHQPHDLASIGIFDPQKRIIYWIDGPNAGKDFYDDAFILSWAGNTFTYRGIYNPNEKTAGQIVTSYVGEKTIIHKFENSEVSQPLSEYAKDFGPRVALLGNELIKSASDKKLFDKLLEKFSARDQNYLKLYMEENRKMISERFEVNSVFQNTDDKTYLLRLIPKPKPVKLKPGGPPEGAPEAEIDLTYDSRTDNFTSIGF